MLIGILKEIMHKAMNRSLFRVFIPVEIFSPKNEIAEDYKIDTESIESKANHQPIEKDSFQKVIEYALDANKVIIVPGYGMAVAQAQFAVIKLSNLLISMGKDVTFAIHPVAGRMPGHMYVLLAEGGIDYTLLKEMDDINPDFEKTDLSLVIGACDVINPAAIKVEGSPISGMPILHTHKSGHVVCCNLDDKPGYSGVKNPLYKYDNTTLLLGNSKETIEQLIENISKTTPDIEEPSNQRDQTPPMELAVAAILSAQKVIIVPGYGMALAQAQFKVVELASMLESMGADVKFAIHPVAGRIPGHMNVLLSEADVDYGKLYEMDDINPEFKQTDIVLIFGACDVVNPSATDTEGTPISGMPILMAHDAKRILVCNFDAEPGYSGVENTLYKDKKTIMLTGDAASTANDLIEAFK